MSIESPITQPRDVNDTKSVQQKRSVYIGVALVGLGVGWLVGLSTSPVVSIIINSVLGVISVIVGTLSGTELKATNSNIAGTDTSGPFRILAETARSLANPWPMAMLIIGLVFGSTFGIWTRTHDWLGDYSGIVEKSREDEWLAINRAVTEWAKLTKRPEDEIAKEFYNARLMSGYVVTPVPIPTSRNGLLFAVSVDDCALFVNAPDDRLVGLVSTSPHKELQELARQVPNPAALEYVIEKFVCEIYVR